MTLLKTPLFHKTSQNYYATKVLSVGAERGISRSLNHRLRNFFTQIMRHYGIIVKWVSTMIHKVK